MELSTLNWKNLLDAKYKYGSSLFIPQISRQPKKAQSLWVWCRINFEPEHPAEDSNDSNFSNLCGNSKAWTELDTEGAETEEVRF